MDFQRIKHIIMELFDKIKQVFNDNKKITLGVVGIPGSGKTYLQSDIIMSFRNMGYMDYDLERDGVMYKSFSDYKLHTERTGVVARTEIYALRPYENIYGLKLVKEGNDTLEICFADIPGEVFDSTSVVNGIPNIQVYFEYRRSLMTCGRVFQVTTWRNDAQRELKIVEPIITNEKEKNNFDARKTLEIEEKYVKEAYKGNSYLNWEYLYSWLNQNHYNAVDSPKEISGKELLNHFFEYQPDSLMRSLAYKVASICPALNMDESDFSSNYLMTFYFLQYCYTATDIVVCDKLLVPKNRTDKDGEVFAKYDTMIRKLADFITAKKPKQCNVYLAFRGVDFLIRKKAAKYKALCNKFLNESSDNNRRITLYSLFAYLLWNIVGWFNPINDITNLGNCLSGAKKPSQEGNTNTDDTCDISIATLTEKYIDCECSGAVINGADNNEPGVMIDALKGVIRPHIGVGVANSFRHLLNAAYGYTRANTMPPHIYFTCTPITQDLEIYENDPDSDNRRFVNHNKTGAEKYFDEAGSHFCFGSYQLCIDILSQHGQEVITEYELGNLLNASINHNY